MNTLEVIQKTREYLDYLENHINNVNRAWQELQDKCKDMRFIYDDYVYFSIGDAVANHDMSKLSKDEFVQYRIKFFPSEDEKKKQQSSEFDSAWENHLKKNHHHWENWVINFGNDSDPYAWECHCVHMVIDWMAMGYKFNDNAKIYYERNKDKINLPEYAVGFIYEIFNRIYK